MDSILDIFKNKRCDGERLSRYGFSETPNGYAYKTRLGENGFSITVSVTPPNTVTAEVYDDESEPYTLHLVEDVCGGFVGVIRAEYERILKDIAENCFKPDAFKFTQSQLITRYALETYGDELEFLWADLPDCAVLRRKDTGKWYAIIMTVSKNKLGLEGAEKVEILDVRANPDELPKIIDGARFFAGYHMNKKHWLTVLLNGSVDIQTIYKYLDISYSLAKK